MAASAHALPGGVAAFPAHPAPGGRPAQATVPDGERDPRPVPFVSIIVPVLNEERYIAPCVKSLLEQTGLGDFEILILDGGSTDGTLAVAAAAFGDERRITLIENPKRIQSAAVNLGARLASQKAAIIVRVDAHAAYSPDFVRDCVLSLIDSGATSVVVPMCTVGRGRFQNAVAAAQNSRLGNGGSAHRVRGGQAGFVEHGHHAAFDRAFFLQLGGYNEAFTHNEDAELDHRSLQAGGRIWMCDKAVVTYFPRCNPGDLAKQYYRHGKGRAKTLLTHRIRPKPRQVAPLAVLGGVGAGTLFIPFFPAFGAAPLAIYSALCVLWAMAAAARSRDPWVLALSLAVMVMHLSWAVGFLRACLDRSLRCEGELGLGQGVGAAAEARLRST